MRRRQEGASRRRPLVSVGHLHEELDPGVGCHGRESPVELLEDDQLHLQYLLVAAGPVRHVGELAQLGRVDLLDLGE